MQARLSSEFEDTREGKDAEAIVRKCVHCGLCNATCPTYQVLGDELDGPRGRIYLIKQLLEGAEVTGSTQLHLDRCLTCRNCETTCPSGVEYGRLVDIGRQLVEERVARPLVEKAARWVLKEGLTSALFAPALKLGQMLRPCLPAVLKDKIPARRRAAPSARATREQPRKVLLLRGCVQPAMMPHIDQATVHVLDAAGIGALSASGAGCCGALRAHLADHEGGLADMRRNIDAWWPLVAVGAVEAIVVNASGCAQQVKQYGRALERDPEYADRAARIASMTRDLTELLPELVHALKDQVRIGETRDLAFHSPCTLQHGQRIRGADAHLSVFGFRVREPADSHLCCGSAGTYSVLQPALARELRDRKLGSLHALDAQCIVSANVGCIQHLQSGTSTPVRHWVEVLDAALDGARHGEVFARRNELIEAATRSGSSQNGL